MSATPEAAPAWHALDLRQFHVIRRNGQPAPFDPNKISVAMTKAFIAVEGHQRSPARIHATVAELTAQVVQSLTRRLPQGGSVHIEDIQDQVELAMMRAGEHKVARDYVLYREERARLRRERDQAAQNQASHVIHLTAPDGTRYPLDSARLLTQITEACVGLADVRPEPILQETLHNLFDGATTQDLAQALVLSARTLIETEPHYSYVTARLLLDQLRTEAFRELGLGLTPQPPFAATYPEYFAQYLRHGIQHELLDPRLGQFDPAQISAALRPEQDLRFTYLGLQTLYDRYFLHRAGQRFELPQAFFMRVAMGLALNEVDREASAIAFYQLLSRFDVMSSTPTLFNAGTLRPQLSSCYLTTVADDLDSIFGAIKDNALLSKFAGGLGNDWSRVRGMNARIKGTNGLSQGVVPFLKVANDTAVAVNQGGKRKGAVCAYLETWHIDIEEFLELRKNTGEERRRTHDMNTANWVPDLFMQRVAEDGAWTLFSPDETPDLHDLTGAAFAARYTTYETLAEQGKLRIWKQVRAQELWRKMLAMLFETGHPWITFKDACNLRSPQQHIGMVHSSNLCTEITLNTSDAEIAVCNLASVNLAQHLTPEGQLDTAHLRHTIRTAVRMLDNVIDINHYSVPQARRSNLKHRPVGLGIMGFQDCLYQLRLPYASPATVEFADRSMELVSYFAILASTELAEERGRYPSFNGSLWSRGILPLDSIALLAEGRGGYLDMDTSYTLDWETLRARVIGVGMRNSNVMAIAPTATISNICGVSQSIEPTYKNLHVKSNLSGEFTSINPYLVQDLKRLGLWDRVMVHDLKYYDGSLQQIERVPEDLKQCYATAFEIDPRWLIEAGSRRQKWLDQAQSLNLYMAEPSGKKLDNLYKLAWVRGLKTTYYLRSIGASHVEKSTLADGKLNAVSLDAPACAIDNPSCEACQ